MGIFKKHPDDEFPAASAGEQVHHEQSFEHASGASSLKAVIDAQYHRPETLERDAVRPRGRSTRLFPEEPAS